MAIVVILLFLVLPPSFAIQVDVSSLPDTYRDMPVFQHFKELQLHMDIFDSKVILEICNHLRGFWCLCPVDLSLTTRDFCSLYRNYKEDPRGRNITRFYNFLRNTNLNHRLSFHSMGGCKLLKNSTDPTIPRVSKLLWKRYKERNFFPAYFKTEQLLSNIEDESSIINFDYYLLKVWYPFRSNISGFALYKYNFSVNFLVKEIYFNQTSDAVDVNNLEMAGNIYPQFLYELVRNLPEDKKLNLRLVMLFINNKSKFSRSGRKDVPIQMIASQIPGFCKTNNFPMMDVRFTSSDWSELGRYYYDVAYYRGYPCFLNQPFYYAWKNGTISTYARDEHCLASTLNANSGKNVSWLFPCYERIYAPFFCMDRYLNIPYFVISSLTEDGHIDFGCFNHRTTNLTESLYNAYIACQRGVENSCKVPDAIDCQFADIFLRISNLGIDGDHVNSHSNLLVKSFELIREYGKESLQLAYLTKVLDYFMYDVKKLIIQPQFIYLNILGRDAITGFLVYASSGFSDLRFITKDNSSIDYSSDDNVELFVSILDNEDDPDCRLNVFVIYDNKFSENGSNYCTSRIIAVQYRCDMGLLAHYQRLKIYFKIIDDEKMWYTQGYWAEIDINNNYLMLICISEPRDNVCSSMSQLYIYQWYDDLSGGHIFNETKIDLDILSQLAVSMNPNAKTIYQRHSTILKIVMTLGTSLSFVGIGSMLVSSIVLRGWCRKRIYTMQLCIALLAELIFFLISNSYTTHLMYLAFYYTVLVQFSLMLIIGYIQYMKFIRVFGNAELSTLKSITFGWITPAVVVVISIASHLDCLACDLCYKNSSIFAQFVVIPISLIILCNLIIYVTIMFKLTYGELDLSEEVKKARLRAAILFPFLFGISWLCIFAAISPSLWISLIGSYLLHLVVPSQGFVLFIFVVALDKDTRCDWVRTLRRVFPIVLTQRESSQSKEISTVSKVI